MKLDCFRLISSLVPIIGFVFFICDGAAQGAADALTPSTILDEMQRVADWQLAHPVLERPTGWICAVGDIGTMALAGISGDPKYRAALLAKGDANHWQLPSYQGRKYHADDQCIGQAWAELYLLYRENEMIEPMRAKMDFILANPPENGSLETIPGKPQQTWSWCDALFMAPPAWMRLYAATGDERYLDYAVSNFWRTADYLYDKDEHLFFRDSTYFNRRETNGAKIFWSRGNGWVFAGIVRMLEVLPQNHPDHARFEQLFSQMAGTILVCQQPDGSWRASLRDSKDYTTPEASGSALFTYGLAWGVNQGLLDRQAYEPAVRKAWASLENCVDAAGRVTHVQPHGTEPVQFPEDSTAPYGCGVFLLAGSEVDRMAILERTKPVVVNVTNPANIYRRWETVEISISGPEADARLQRLSKSAKQIALMDGTSSRILDSQTYWPDGKEEKLLFQVDLAPGETRTYDILDAATLPATPPPILKTPWPAEMKRLAERRDQPLQVSMGR